MANVNTFAGLYNLTQVIGTTTETTLLVPTASGSYPGLPSPQFPLSTTSVPVGLYIAPPPDISGSELDGHPMRIRIAGVITNGASDSFNLKMYVGTSATIASNTTMASYAQVAATTVSYPFWAEQVVIWDSTSQKVWGTLESYFNGVYTAKTTTSCTSVSVASISLLNFIPSFTFATANASNSVLVREFTLERV